VHRYLSEFVAKTADLKGIGIVFVIVTAFLLVWQVESEINAISTCVRRVRSRGAPSSSCWGSPRDRRRSARRFTS